MDTADVDIIDFLEGPTPLKPVQGPPTVVAGNVKVPPELPLKPKAKITIYIDIPSMSLYNKELKLLPTLTADQLISKLQKKKILPEGHPSVAIKWHMTHVPKKAPMETQDLTSDGPRALWELGVRDQDLVILSADRVETSSCPSALAAAASHKKEKESLLNRFKKTLRGSMTNIRSGAIGETSGSGDLSGGGNGGGSGSGSPLGLLFHIPLELVADLGPPLMSSTMYGVPLFIELAFTYLEREESTTEGIFRLSGSASAIKAYKKIIDAGGQIEWQPGSDAHNATGLIKLYLRELPEPLLTFKLFDALTVICGLQPEHEQLQIRLLSLCLRSLPRCNYNLLRYILIHLRGLARQEEYTKMGIPNLATLLGPNIAKPVGADTCEDQQEMFTMTSQASLIAGCLLRHCDKLFDGPDAQEEREFCGVASLSFNWEPPEASEDELAFSQGEIVFLREGPPHSSDNRDDWVSVMTIREGDVYYGRLPSSYLEAIHTHRELGEIQSGGVDEHVDVAMDDESGAEKVTCDLEQETDELRHKASAKESSPLAENPMARDDEFFDEPQPSSDQGLLLLPGAPPGKGMFASSQSLDESGDLDLSQRIAQLESQVAMLKVELHEERSQRENLAKIIPMLMQNQDQVLALLHGLHSGGNNSNNNGIQGDGDPQ